MNTKEDFHKLIDNIEDEKVLDSYFNLIQQLSKNQTGALWNGVKRGTAGRASFII